jgi:hypothetical protein
MVPWEKGISPFPSGRRGRLAGDNTEENFILNREARSISFVNEGPTHEKGHRDKFFEPLLR